MKEEKSLEWWTNIFKFDTVKHMFKYYPCNGELLRYQGSNIMMLTFKYDEKTGNRNRECEVVMLISVSKFDSETGTYEVTYLPVDYNSEKEKKTCRVNSFGISILEDQSSTEDVYSFVPMSMFNRQVEDSNFNELCENLSLNMNTGLPIEKLGTIAKFDKEQREKFLGNNVYIAVIVRYGYLPGDVFTFRLQDIEPKDLGYVCTASAYTDFGKLEVTPKVSPTDGDGNPTILFSAKIEGKEVTVKFVDLSDF